MMAMAIQTTTKKTTMTRNEWLRRTVDKDGNEVSMGNYAVYHAGTGTDFSLLDRDTFIVDKNNLKHQLQLAGDEYFDERYGLVGLSREQIDSSAERIAPTHLLIEAWQQAYELFADYEDLNDEDIIACREVMHERVKQIMAMLHDFVPEDMSKYEASF